MRGRPRVSIVLNHAIKALFPLLVLTVLAACGRLVGPRDGASFCRPNEILGMRVVIDFRESKGTWEDVRMPLRACGDTELACVGFPVLFSAPPDEDWSSKLPVSWEAGSANFTIEQVSNDPSDHFLVTARDSSIVMFYNYSPDQGVLSFRLGDSEEDRWNLCGGRLTFDRLKAWHASAETVEKSHEIDE